MARVFTIAPGLENMGALKTGGQGSVYKGRRTGEVITAVKILPTPIYAENEGDKNYLAFKNEVAKLTRVNEKPNPYVVKIINSGITEAGNFPFIEMEFIEGSDLEELLKPPHPAVFTLSETLKVAEQIANAIAHCHSMGVRHGDIKSNNIKLNTESGNYILLDFGLAIMSDEQRRNSYRQAGAIEFMAPEQNSGQMLLQTDVYSFGVILFELLTGSAPFPLKDNGESARNEVRLAHMVSPVPDLLQMRRAALPGNWSFEKQQHEMQVPNWLLMLIYKCLEKKPEKRFSNGNELFNFIIQKSVSNADESTQATQFLQLQHSQKEILAREDELKKQLTSYKSELLEKENELAVLQRVYSQTEQEVANLTYQPKPKASAAGAKKVSAFAFFTLLLVTSALAAFVAYPFVKSNFGTVFTNQKMDDSVESQEKSDFNNRPLATGVDTVRQTRATILPTKVRSDSAKLSAETATDSIPDQVEESNLRTSSKNPSRPIEKAADESTTETATDNTASSKDEESETPPAKTEQAEENNPNNTNAPKKDVLKKYLVVSKAFFYNNPDENTRREEYISPLDKAVVDALQERYGFIYVVITTPQGQVYKGWLRKRDLQPFYNG